MACSTDPRDRLFPIDADFDAGVRFGHFVALTAVAAGGWWECGESLIHDAYGSLVMFVGDAFEAVEFGEDRFTLRASLLGHWSGQPPDLIAAIASLRLIVPGALAGHGSQIAATRSCASLSTRASQARIRSQMHSSTIHELK